jgi:hypothetical protein
MCNYYLKGLKIHKTIQQQADIKEHTSAADKYQEHTSAADRY